MLKMMRKHFHTRGMTKPSLNAIPLLILSVTVVVVVVGTATVVAFVSTTPTSPSRSPFQLHRTQQQNNRLGLIPSTTTKNNNNNIINIINTNSPIRQQRLQRSHGKSSMELHSFMGSDGGILGIGTPELVSNHSQYCIIISTGDFQKPPYWILILKQKWL
jgi:predicted PurR-regulated permease PerM